ncbi:conserved protein of unknown function [Sterolibacterium denitrificans]|uniref:Polymerase nucleotidyl transferase domain-containing protein n=1 Tax=Sterolibacterium denitrificans TaxID=157592 RepID=A0A7Z7HRR9_9PROT|nr:nucleotidyltransferase domain-containing protein [Sterolibacterium denitrificans]SMB28095.1 conserved protein of unknown function [Sterolibacterium denitrificans]
MKNLQELVQALSAVDRVSAVALGGSRGLGTANENSDYDFVVFRAAGEAIPPAQLADALQPFADAGKISNQAGFVSAQIAGRKLEIFQKDLNLIEREIQLSRQGKFRWYIRQLFPHGDLSTCRITHLIHLEICQEHAHCLSRLRQLAWPFPPPLMRSLASTFLTQTTITLMHARKIRRAEEVQHLVALCSAFVFFSNIVLFAINRQYPLLEKGNSTLIREFTLRPERYEYRATTLFKAAADGALQAVTDEMAGLQQELGKLVQQALAASVGSAASPAASRNERNDAPDPGR